MIDHMLGHKTSLNKIKKTEIMSSIFSYHNGMKTEINHKKKKLKKILKTFFNLGQNPVLCMPEAFHHMVSVYR